MSTYAFDKEKKTWLDDQISFSNGRSSIKRKGWHDMINVFRLTYKSLQKILEFCKYLTQ